MPIPSWVINIEDKGVRERALGLWADFQRARERAQLDHQKVVFEADVLHTATVTDALFKRDGAIRRARDVYDRAKKDLLETSPLRVVEKAQ